MGVSFTNRRRIVVGAGAVILCGAVAAAVRKFAGGNAPAAEWESISPQDAGFDADLAARIDDAVRGGRARNVHGVVVARGGRLVVERYYAGADEIAARPAAHIVFGPNVLHDLRSVTKSIVGLLYGIALAAGKVPAPEQPLLAQFPEYGDLAADARRARWTVAHALTMTLGTEWNEDVSYRDPSNSETAMEEAADRYRFILDRPFVAEPGARWNYCGGATALIARLIAKGTGQTLPEFARAALFDPLGIRAFEWRRAGDGEPRAASGLRMMPRDVARVGQLVLDGGFRSGRSIVPFAWLEMSCAPKIAIDAGSRAGRRYGYHWYIADVRTDGPAPRSEQWVGGVGNGGQRLFLLPGRKLVVAITAGNYNSPDQGDPPLVVLREVILPSMKSG